MRNRLLWVIVFTVIVILFFGFVAIMQRDVPAEPYMTEPSVNEDGFLHAGQIYLEPEVPYSEDMEGPQGAIPVTEEELAGGKRG